MCVAALAANCIPLVTSVVNKKKSSPVLYEWQKMSLMPTTNKRIDKTFPVRAATNYLTRAWQTLIYGKECYIVIVIYLPFKHKQSK